MSEQRRGGGTRWRYRFGGEVHGPVGFDELRARAARGELPRHAQVAEEGGEDWRDAGLMPALADAWAGAAASASPSAASASASAPKPPPEPAAVPAEPPPAARGSVPSTAAGAARREPPPGTTAVSQTDVTFAHVVYGLYALNFFIGFTGLVGVVIAYIKRGAAAGSWLGSHFRWQIRTFWYGLAIAVVALLLARFLGWLVALVGGIWLIYRIYVGWRNLFGRQPIGDVDPIENFIWRQAGKISGSSSSRRS